MRLFVRNLPYADDWIPWFAWWPQRVVVPLNGLVTGTKSKRVRMWVWWEWTERQRQYNLEGRFWWSRKLWTVRFPQENA